MNKKVKKIENEKDDGWKPFSTVLFIWEMIGSIKYKKKP